MNKCSIENCIDTAWAKGWCNKHYARWRKNGDPIKISSSYAAIRSVDNPDGTRKCNSCGENKNIEDFAISKNCKRGRRGSCKECRRIIEKINWKSNAHRPSRDPKYKRNERLKRLFGISLQDYDDMFKQQKGLCFICKQPQSWNRREGEILAVDHDHVTGQVRALLCNACNQALGLMQDNPETLIAAAAYITYFKELQQKQMNGESLTDDESSDSV